MTAKEFLQVKGLLNEGEEDYPMLTNKGHVSLVDLLTEFSGFATLEPAGDRDVKPKKKA